MSAIANPLVQPPPNSGANLVGWGVPTSPGSGGVKSASGANPYMPFINPTAATSGSTNPNPYAGGFPANQGGYPSTNLNPGGTTPAASDPNNIGLLGPNSNAASMGFPTTAQGQKELYTNLEKAYGHGMAGTLMNFLAGGAGFNQQAINNLIAAMQPGFNKANQDLLQNFSAGGSRFSSGAALGMSNLQSQEQLNIGALESQMYEQSVNDYINVMMGMSQGDLTEHQRSNKQGSNFFSGLLGGIGSLVGDILPGIFGGGGDSGDGGGGGGSSSSGGGGDFGGSSSGGF